VFWIWWGQGSVLRALSVRSWAEKGIQPIQTGVKGPLGSQAVWRRSNPALRITLSWTRGEDLRGSGSCVQVPPLGVLS
jgi:hypothetical protein